MKLNVVIPCYNEVLKVVFEIEEGERTLVKKIIINGNSAFSDTDLQNQNTQKATHTNPDHYSNTSSIVFSFNFTKKHRCNKNNNSQNNYNG